MRDHGAETPSSRKPMRIGSSSKRRAGRYQWSSGNGRRAVYRKGWFFSAQRRMALNGHERTSARCLSVTVATPKTDARAQTRSRASYG